MLAKSVAYLHVIAPISVKIDKTRMHSSRMHTARSSSSSWGVCLSACWDTPPQVWAWGSPLGVGLETPPPARPLKLPLECGPGNLQGMLGYQPPPPPVDGQTRVKT